MDSEFILRIFDVEHGACAIMQAPNGRIAMIDCGHNATTGWRPSTYLRYHLDRTKIDYFFVTNADQDHLSDLAGLRVHGVEVATLVRNGSPSEPVFRILKQAQGELTNDIERFLEMHDSYRNYAVPFNDAIFTK